jgi:peptide methionine sulfoxide reductase MsrB
MAIPHPTEGVEKSEEEWKAQLTAEQFYVTRKHGTEASFSHDLAEAMTQDYIPVFVVTLCYLILLKNLTLEQGGQVLPACQRKWCEIY